MDENIGKLIIDHFIQKWAVLNEREFDEIKEEIFHNANPYKLRIDELLYRFAESYKIPTNKITAVLQYEIDHMSDPLPIYFHKFIQSLYQVFSDRNLWQAISAQFKDEIPTIDDSLQYSLEVAYCMFWAHQQNLPIDFTIAILVVVNIIPYLHVHHYYNTIHESTTNNDIYHIFETYLKVIQKEAETDVE